MRVKNPSLLGAFTGCLLTTLAYVVLSSMLSLTWDANSSAKVREDLDRRDAVPNTPIFNLGGGVKSPSPSQKFVHQAREDVEPSKQNLVRKMLLNVIATSKDNLRGALHKVNTSWGQDTEEWWMAVGTSAKELPLSTRDHVFVVPQCQGFPKEEYLSPRQLFSLLEAIYDSFYADYQWFFIATEPIYVSVYQLERHLTTLDSDGEMVYMGRPHTDGSYCIGESGVVLSHKALREIVPQLKTCIEGNDSGPSTEKGDLALGTCFMKLHETCHQDDVSKALYWHTCNSQSMGMRFLVNNNPGRTECLR